jgi:hypothetical protein
LTWSRAWAHASALRELGVYAKAFNHKRGWRTIKKAIVAISDSDEQPVGRDVERLDSSERKNALFRKDLC